MLTKLAGSIKIKLLTAANGESYSNTHFYTVWGSKNYDIVVNWDYVNLYTVIYIVYEVSGVLLLTCECD